MNQSRNDWNTFPYTPPYVSYSTSGSRKFIGGRERLQIQEEMPSKKKKFSARFPPVCKI